MAIDELRRTLCCYHCGRFIKGQAVIVTPPDYLIRMGDFTKAYHPRCHAVAEKIATAELAPKK